MGLIIDFGLSMFIWFCLVAIMLIPLTIMILWFKWLIEKLTK